MLGSRGDAGSGRFLVIPLAAAGFSALSLACSSKETPAYDPPSTSAFPSPSSSSSSPAPRPRGADAAVSTPAPAATRPLPTPGAAPAGNPPAVASAAPVVPMIEEDAVARTLEEQREQMYRRMVGMLGLTEAQISSVRAIVEKSRVLSQGNPELSKHPLTRAQCREAREAAGVVETTAPVCGKPYMAPLYDRERGKPEDAKLCIDRYEFPGIPCEYPVAWVSSREAASLCKAVGKRLCDAHEWEGACAGAVRPPEEDYDFKKPRKQSKYDHNKAREVVWSYGKEKDHKKCGTGSFKNKTCSPIGWKRCGTNTYPAGSFPQCVSPYGAFDLHGNAAEHMSLPTKAEELGAKGGLGETEMKGSWFVFGQIEAHEDDCRWRAPDWHGTAVMDPNSHANYHLGFRCCGDVAGNVAVEGDATPGN